MQIAISVINECTNYDDTRIHEMVPAFTKQWNDHLRPVWGLNEAGFEFVPKDKAKLPTADTWWLVFLDNSDQADALAYHDLTVDGQPLSKVFVETIVAEKAAVSVAATHEICEMAVDPWLNAAYQDDRGRFWAAEICDPVEADDYAYEIDGTLVTNFITPDWYAHKYSKPHYDYGSCVKRPFEVLTGGYAQLFDPNQGWVQVTGTKAAMSAQAKAPNGSRRERRARAWIKGADTLTRSIPTWLFQKR